MSCYGLLPLVLILSVAAGAPAAEALPMGSAPPPVPLPHFPDRVHALVWRNWTVVPAERLARVLDTSVGNVRAVAASMGLPDQPAIQPQWRTRGYITVLRRNWHLLPYDQLLVLLDLSAEQLAYCLREDDFLFSKLGGLKPKCPPLACAPPTRAARRRAAEIRTLVRATFGQDFLTGGEPRFRFVEDLSTPTASAKRTDAQPGRFHLRFIYSYFAMYGDPLSDPALDPYPDGLLGRLADVGASGVWLHTVLRTLAPSETFPEFGDGWQARLAGLRKLVERAKAHGIGVYLYVNEPRAMPASFFAKRPRMRGVQEGDHFAMCTSDPRVRQWLTDALAHVFREVPGLAGVFTITASENLTNCASHGRHTACPNCKDRSPAEIIAEVNAAVEAGVRRGNPDAKTIVWDWGWRDALAPEIIARLPKRAWLMSVSEWSKPIVRGGVRTTVGEYSISAVGPGPRATKHWALAKAAGLKTVAKVQLNNTWELSAVPYLPVLDLVAEHCRALAGAGIDGMMLSWSLGGYPSPNLEVAERFSRRQVPTIDDALDDVARSCFGPDGAESGRKAWAAFSDAFRQFPFHISVLYRAPSQYAPANLLYARPTGYRATMIGFPYDDVDGWRGPYPADVLATQFAKVASGWERGLPPLSDAVRRAPPDRRADADAQLRFARAAWLHFRAVANQTRFTIARNALSAKGEPPDGERRAAMIARMRRAASDEIEVAREVFRLAKQDSRIAYEASNHYYYLPIDLVEKVINCRYLLDHNLPEPAP